MALLELEVIDAYGRASYRVVRGTLNPDGSVSLGVANASGGTSTASTAVPQATSNMPYAGGAGPVFTPASGRTGHLYSVTVKARGAADSSLTDGQSGAEIAYIPANFLGDIPIYSPKFFATSVYAQANCPAISIGLGA